MGASSTQTDTNQHDLGQTILDNSERSTCVINLQRYASAPDGVSHAHELDHLTKAKHALDVEIADIRGRMASVPSLLQPLVLTLEGQEFTQLTIANLQKIHLNVKDAAKSANFLSFIFSVPKPEVSISPEGDKTSFILTIGSMRLELHQEEQQGSGGPRKVTSGLGLKFTTQTASIEAVRRALATKNVSYSHKVPGSFHALEFTDPDDFQREVVDTGRNPALALASLVRRDEPDETLVREASLAAPNPKMTATATVEEQGRLWDKRP